MRFGRLLIRFSHFHVIIFWSLCGSRWYRIRKGQSVMIPVAVIHRDKSIWGDDATEFKLVLFLISLLFSYPTCFFLLDLSVGRMFRMLPLLFLESGRTCWHSMGDLELVSVFDFHLWSESYFPLRSHPFLIFFLNFFFCLCIRTKGLLFTLVRAFEMTLRFHLKI